MSFNEDYHDAIIVRQLLLNRVASGLSDKVEKVYQNIINEITQKMRTYDKINEKTLKKIIRDLSLYVNPDLDFMSEELNKLAFAEVQNTVKKANEIADYMLFSVAPPKDVIKSIFNTSLMAAGDRAYTLTDWFKGIDNALLNKIDGAVKMGMVQGETGAQLSERMQQLGIKTVHDAKAIALTSVSHIAHNAREAVYNKNADVIKGWKSVATLDYRTSLLCASYDGALYDFKTHKGLNEIGKEHAYFPPPRHPNCRSVHIIITKSYKEMGIPLDEISTTARSSLDGQIPADTTFTQWIESKTPKQIKKYLGAGRYELYKDGKITFSDLVNQRGRTLTIDELINK